MYQVSIENGKYTFVNNHGLVSIKRHGEVWRNEVGDKALLCLLQHVEKLEEEIERLKEPVKVVELNLVEGTNAPRPYVGVRTAALREQGRVMSQSKTHELMGGAKEKTWHENALEQIWTETIVPIGDSIPIQKRESLGGI